MELGTTNLRTEYLVNVRSSNILTGEGFRDLTYGSYGEGQDCAGTGWVNFYLASEEGKSVHVESGSCGLRVLCVWESELSEWRESTVATLKNCTLLFCINFTSCGFYDNRCVHVANMSTSRRVVHNWHIFALFPPSSIKCFLTSTSSQVGALVSIVNSRPFISSQPSMTINISTWGLEPFGFEPFEDSEADSFNGYGLESVRGFYMLLRVVCLLDFLYRWRYSRFNVHFELSAP